MKLVIFACLLAFAVARPQEENARTLNSENINEGDGTFRYSFNTDNEIAVEANGVPGIEGQSNIDGTFRFPLGDGSYLEVVYVADENGYRPQISLSRS